jgi:hypothetical protein
MVKYQKEIVVVQTNFDLIFDIFTFVGLTCLLPLLEIAHTFIKFSQQKNVFACDYVAAIKVCQGQFYGLYNDPNPCYISNAFKDFKDIVDYKHGTLSLRWITFEFDLNILGVEYLAV